MLLCLRGFARQASSALPEGPHVLLTGYALASRTVTTHASQNAARSLTAAPRRERRENRGSLDSPPGAGRLTLTLDVENLSDLECRRQDAGPQP